jgi:adenine-specific DNA-methyltransferase
MKDKYTGSLSLEWYNKQKTILLRDKNNSKETDIPAPLIDWINKEDSLFYEILEEESLGMKPFWVEKSDIRVKEARPLKFVKGFKALKKSKPGTLEGMDSIYEMEEVDSEDPSIKNLLIRGDNLLALNSLKNYFDKKDELEKVKCVYIDPPYNTQSTFLDYDDNLEHSEWLTLMRDRLILIHSLLRNDGFIFVQIDEKEQAYLKILLDEVFGRDNLINQVVIKTKPSAGASGGGEDKKFKKNIEYLLIYSKSKDFDFSMATEKEYRDLFELIDEMEEEGKSWKYTSILIDKGKFESTLTIKDGQDKDIKVNKYSGVKRTTINQILKERLNSNPKLDKKEEEKRIYSEFFESIFSDTNSQSSIRTRVIDAVTSLADNELLEIEYIPVSGKDKGKMVQHYYISNSVRRVIWLKDTAEKNPTTNSISKADVLSTLWLGMNWNNVTKEGNIQFPSGKKPEGLIERILEIATEEGDIVLDSFAGSGTTAAVAHKMGRNWITIEIGNHAETKIIPRLKNVLLGENQSGICSNNWFGGGSFKYCQLGESIIKIGKDKSVEFNWNLGKSFIEESFLLSYDYELITDFNFNEGKLFKEDSEAPKIGIQKIGNKVRIAIVTLCPPDNDNIMLKYDELHSMYKKVMDKYKPEFINVFTNKGVEIAFETKPEKLEVIKVPTAIYSTND